MRTIAIKEFEIHEGSTANSWHEIKVYFNGYLVDKSFETDDVRENCYDFERAADRLIDFVWRKCMKKSKSML